MRVAKYGLGVLNAAKARTNRQPPMALGWFKSSHRLSHHHEDMDGRNH